MLRKQTRTRSFAVGRPVPALARRPDADVAQRRISHLVQKDANDQLARPRRSGRKEQPVTQSGRSIEEEATFESVGGLTIAYRSWRTTERARGLVIIVPGFNSHSGYYSWVANELIAQGLSVYALDLRGRGRSDG